ncbi:hypothetical protein SAMN05444851_3357 [Aliiroseovarius sediminilitoris]|uniref:Uncharacterized protein n=1 Tax=Aliiroseovarius sediminilitoris TaxID=1173584 RepID=A0A1I0RCX1_9RHOB|nr:hypothetical protein [Aliiroseovarius sediminilitoris]SEW38088.1 hypothetical protein SAMN05444851_3357 [Aliiroseovarius sediminilitoris]
MKTLYLAILAGIMASPAFANHDQTLLHEAVNDGHSHGVGVATAWLGGTAVAMIIALVAVQKVVYRKR